MLPYLNIRLLLGFCRCKALCINPQLTKMLVILAKSKPLAPTHLVPRYNNQKSSLKLKGRRLTNNAKIFGLNIKQV